MTIREITRKYENAILEASEVCIKEKQEFLKENKLDGMVKRIEDGKIGWFIVGYQRDIVFYPMKKDGTRSLNSGGWFNEDRILDLFEPYNGGDAGMTIEGHIENLKAIASDMPSDKCCDWIESLMAGINAMEELQAHREAWEKVELRLKELSIVSDSQYYLHREDNWFDGINDAISIVGKYRPKEGDNNDN